MILCIHNAFVLFFSSFIVYLHTLCPTIYLGDSPQVITACLCLGVAHPPGYPLHTLLGNLCAQLIFLGNPAFKINLMEAFFASTAGVRLYVILKNLNVNRLIAFTTALFIIFSKTFWFQTTIVKPYMANLFFIFLIIYLLQRWESHENNYRYIYLISFTGGIALGNHYLLIFAAIPFAIFIGYKNTGIVKTLQPACKSSSMGHCGIQHISLFVHQVA